VKPKDPVTLIEIIIILIMPSKKKSGRSKARKGGKKAEVEKGRRQMRRCRG
jgi:hypothetical protein